MLTALVALSCVGLGPATPPPDALRVGFQNPPDWAKPYTWWHWMAGNVTKEGITADLEAMKFAGIGGAHIFDAGQGIPPGPVAYNSPQWRDLMAHAMKEAQRLGLDMTMHNCSGWSSSGGPWVKPEDAMKKVVWSVAEVDDVNQVTTAAIPHSVGGFYRDIAVFVFPTPEPTPGGGNSLGSLTGMEGSPGPNPDLNWPVIPPTTPLTVWGPDAQNHPKFHIDAKTQAMFANKRATVLRIGYTLTGTHNVASRPSGEGLEVDKFSAKSLDHFMAGCLEPLFKRIGAPLGKAFRTVLIDSYETGPQNWTANMVADFKRLRGYDPTPYLPALCGFAVKDRDTTKRFLFDFRRTLTDLWGENYSGHYAKRLKEYGLQLAVEPYGNGSFDPFTYAKPAGLIMGEYWVGEGQINGSVKQSASVAHVYGHHVVGAESLTAAPNEAGWRNDPRQWKPFADRSFAYGINRIIYHRFAHQPWVKGVLPGMTMGPWGSHVDRTETYWSYMPSWDKYLQRCHFILQSGLFAGDVCVFTGEGEPQEATGENIPMADVPKGYDFDYCGLDPLMAFTASNGLLHAPNGPSYRVLALPNTDRMALPLARKIRSLVLAGATVLGPKPSHTPSLADGPSGDTELTAIANELWGPGKSGMRKVGKGMVCWGASLQSVLRSVAHLGPDFTPSAPKVLDIHRKIGDTDAYFVCSSAPFPRTITCTFRVSGKEPQLWHAETGRIERAPVWHAGKGATVVDVPLTANGSVFVVFQSQRGKGDHLVKRTETSNADVRAPELPIHIVRAEYGQLDVPGKFRDVTKLVAAAVQGSNLEISASNDELGGDPAYMVVKSLRVVYRVGDQEKTVTVPENETITLGEVPNTGGAPSSEVKATASRSELRIWKNGAYSLSWASGKRKVVKESNLPAPLAVSGPWEVHFPAGWDAPAKTTFDELIPWNESEEFGIKYFSGTATYRKTLNVPSSLVGKNLRLMLDLGDVRECARIRVNGKLVGEFWTPPYRADVTEAIHAGDNSLEVEVTNLWVNRLIGDEQFPDDMGWEGDHLKGWPDWFVKGLPRPEPRRKTFTTWRRNTKDTPLLPSGLIGPVLIRPVRVVPLTGR